MFHKTIHKAWNLFKLSEHSPENSVEKSWFFDFQSIKQESSSDQDIQKLQNYFFTISIDQAKVSTDRKCLTSNFHLENSRTWIFTIITLWNNILQTQTSLLQSIHVYTYIYNNPPLGCNNICLTWLIFYHAYWNVSFNLNLGMTIFAQPAGTQP